jgi:hypothetical protein
MTSTVLLKCGKNYRITVYVFRETLLKEMADKIKLSQHLFFTLVRELAQGNPYTELCVKTLYSFLPVPPQTLTTSQPQHTAHVIKWGTGMKNLQ